MENHKSDRSEAERAFRESLERLREAMQSKPDATEAAPPTEPPPSPTNDAALWEDAIEDIDRFLESRNPSHDDRESD